MDITRPRVLYLKAALFVCGGILASTIILVDHPSWKVAAMLTLAIWCFARAYYFAFYVVQQYADPTYRFAGLGAFVMYLVRRGRARSSNDAREP
jgi:hypothetical protein